MFALGFAAGLIAAACWLIVVVRWKGPTHEG
jgi:hypothetical protein